jgi:protein JSN1
MARSISSDHNNLTPYDLYGISGVNGLGGLNAIANPGFGQEPAMSINQPQLQYQAFLAAQSRGISPGGFYPAMTSNGFNGFSSASASIDNFRAIQSHSVPLTGPPAQLNASPMLSQPAFAHPQFGSILNGSQMYQYPQQFYHQQPQAAQSLSSTGRRGRVSHVS